MDGELSSVPPPLSNIKIDELSSVELLSGEVLSSVFISEEAAWKRYMFCSENSLGILTGYTQRTHTDKSFHYFVPNDLGFVLCIENCDFADN